MRFFPWEAFDFISNSSRKLSGRLCEKKNGQTFGHLSHHLNVFLFYLLTFNYQNSAHKTENTFYFVKVFFTLPQKIHEVTIRVYLSWLEVFRCSFSHSKLPECSVL